MIIEENPDSDMFEMLLNKQLPFTELEYLETFVFTIRRQKYKKKAVEQLKIIADPVKIKYVENKEANINVAYFLLMEALSTSKNEILTKIIQNNRFPVDFLKKIAENGKSEILEVLSENQIKLIAYPELIELMERNPNINNFVKGKLDEIKRFYLTGEKAEEIKADGLTDDIFTISAEEKKGKTDVGDDEDEGLEEKVKTEESEEDEETVLLTENVQQQVLTRLQEINNMTVAERIKTALLGTKSDRALLIRDPNKLVAQAVIESPKMSIDEISAILKNKSVSGDLISKIAKKKEWIKNYQIIVDLVMNPKTPVSFAVGFLKKLHANDLKMVKRDKNVSPVIRKFALQMQAKKGG